MILFLATGCESKREGNAQMQELQKLLDEYNVDVTFDLARTVEVLRLALELESIDVGFFYVMIDAMSKNEIQGAIRAEIIKVNEGVYTDDIKLEVESEDNRIYIFDLVRRDRLGGRPFRAHSVRDMQTNELFGIGPSCGMWLMAEYFMEEREPVEFDVAATIEVLQPLLEEEILTEESNIIQIMQREGVRGAVRANWINEPYPRSHLEIESEDGIVYRFTLNYRIDANGTTYFVRRIFNPETNRSRFHVFSVPEEDGVEFRRTRIRD